MSFLVFLYGVSIGFPDVALPVWDTRIRLDDVLIAAILLISLFNRSTIKKYDNAQKKIILWYLGFAIYCSLSFLFVFLHGMHPESWLLLRLIECLMILVGLTSALKKPGVLMAFGHGILIGALAMLMQVGLKWKMILSPSLPFLDDFYFVKDAVGFDTWNPNSLGIYAIVFAFILAIIGSDMHKQTQKLFWWGSVALLSALPMLIFARSAALSIVLSWSLFILITKQNRWLKAMAFVGVALPLIGFMSKNPFLFFKAADVDILTGRGLGQRVDFWRTAWSLFLESPLAGNGFGMEHYLFARIWGAGSAHNAYLSVMVDSGFFGLFLFLMPLWIIFTNLTHLLSYENNIKSDICMSFFLGILFLGLSHSGLYWSKPAFIFISLIIVCLESSKPGSRRPEIIEFNSKK